MPALSVDAIRKRAAKFSKQFAGVSSEKQQDQNFMRGFCEVFGINPNRAQWQFTLKNGKSTNWADGILPGMALFEMKSAGMDMHKAYEQAADYVRQLQDKDVPEFIIVSDFANIHVYHGKQKTEILLEEFSGQLDCLLPLVGYEAKAVERQNAINEAAAERIGRLHDLMKANKYRGKDLETYLVRLLFCLFADDTGLFGENHQFMALIQNTKVDGSDLHGELAFLFDTLNTPVNERADNLGERFRGFPYVNGSLFADILGKPYSFDEESRASLLELTKEDWSEIDPSIFGNLFQAIMHHDDEAATAKTKKRRELGAHYTSEANILKVINPLFMDDLRKEFESVKRSPKALGLFHEKLANLQLFDPACGCGNFLVIAYRELRLLELDVIEILHGKALKASKQQSNVEVLVRLKVDQFHGIEIDSTAARIATVAMWLTDHQMNLKVARLGGYLHRLPLTDRPNIICDNALRVDWASVIAPDKCSFIMGNPPFIGYSYQSQEQKADLALVFKDMHGAGVLDYVTAWHVTAARYIQSNPSITVGFVSTNSITQGEQVAILWAELLRLGIHIYFAHRTFRWSNEGRGIAAVHCIIMGMGMNDPEKCRLYDYLNVNADPEEISVARINPYLLDAPTLLIDKRRQPLCAAVPEMIFGSKATDGGNLLLSAQEAEEIMKNDRIAAKYMRQFLGAEEFINNISRYCLWLTESTANDRKASPEIQKRIKAVKEMRLQSPKIPTQKLADTPYLFGEIRQTHKPYLLIPLHSSEARRFIPMGYFEPDVICGNANSMIPNASLFHFGVLSSTMHNAWIRITCGRIKSDFRYSNTIVYNNFPWPSGLTQVQIKAIETAAQAVLDARKLEEQRCAKQGQACSLAALYAPDSMPVELMKAHRALDKAVDAAYENDGYDKKKTTDADRVAFFVYALRGFDKTVIA